MVWCQIVQRKMPLIMSAAPATAKQARTSHMLGASPASATDAAPGRRGDDHGPAVVVHARRSSREVAVASRLPTVSAV